MKKGERERENKMEGNDTVTIQRHTRKRKNWATFFSTEQHKTRPHMLEVRLQLIAIMTGQPIKESKYQGASITNFFPSCAIIEIKTFI